MTRIRLSDLERKILAEMQYAADGNLAQHSRRIGVRPHRLHYALQRLQQKKVLYRGLVLDFYALGFLEYEIFFSLGGSRRDLREELFRFFRSCPDLLLFAELAGEYQYQVIILARSMDQIVEFLARLEAAAGGNISEKTISCIVSFSLYNRAYLSAGSPGHAVTCRCRSPVAGLDRLDWRILRELWHRAALSHNDLASRLHVSRPTIDARLRRLAQAGVVVKQTWFAEFNSLGVTPFRILLKMRGLKGALSAPMARFCEKQPHVVNLYDCVGHWDYEIGIEVEHAGEVSEIVKALQAVFGEKIGTFQIVAALRYGSSPVFLDNAVPKQ